MNLFNIMRSKCISTTKNENDMAFNSNYHIFQIDERIVNCHNLHFWVFQRSAHNQPSNAAKSKSNGTVQKLITRQRQWSLKEFIEERAVKPTSYFYLRTRWFQPWPSWAKLLGVILWQNKQLDLSYEMNNTNRSKNQHWITASSKDLKESAIYL